MKYSVSQSLLFTTDKSSTQFPGIVQIDEVATDNNFMHIEFESEGIEEVYLSLHKTDHDPTNQLRVNAIAQNNNEVTFEFN